MKTCVVAFVVCACGVACAEPHLGFDVEDVKKSVVVSRIYEASLATAAGVLQGDVVTKVAKRPVKKASDVAAVMEQQSVGGVVDVVVRRGGKQHVLRLIVSDGNDVRRRSREAKEIRERTAQAMHDAAIATKEQARNAAIAEDPELETRLQGLLEEWQLLKDSPSDVDKAAHCKRIAQCYLKLRDKDEYLRWSSQANWYLFGRKTSGGF